VCLKIGHTADRCWYRFDKDYVPEPRHNAAAATSSYSVDTHWYTDSGATDHITSKLDKLAAHDQYNGAGKVHTASGAGMEISHTSNSFIHTSTRQLKLSNILHVPKATRNLLSIHHFALDNNIFFEIHPWFFLIKDRDTKNIILRGRCHNGLYPIPAAPKSIKFSFAVNKPSLTRWHDRLGHPSFQVVQRVLREFNLPIHLESNKDSVCGPCQHAKSHQHPYPKSTSMSS
jgi:hypothetical protein